MVVFSAFFFVYMTRVERISGGSCERDLLKSSSLLCVVSHKRHARTAKLRPLSLKERNELQAQVVANSKTERAKKTREQHEDTVLRGDTEEVKLTNRSL